ncbi:DMT family transporter [Roseobacter sp. N2S]|uniref:DMT family transporter n=1 Tax=Roseobacter sp. N2S TaxID=2663844 RepID=UPI002854459D|nr:DMT family transporter [Roseobacter sp. N2S]MDR6266407.1 drug/metabolite transporter (DMT)-like permease [Roseobacter sp. N2S]
MTPTVSNTTKGAAMMVACMAIIGLVDNYVVLIAKEAGLWQFHLCRSALVCGALALMAWGMGWRIKPRRWQGVAIRACCGAVSMAVYFGALAVLPVAQVGAGLFTAPIFVLLFSVLVFRTPIGLWRVLAAVVGFAGVLLMLRPDFTALNLITILPMLAGVTWALTALSTRYLCEGEDTVTLLFWFFAALGAIGAAGLLVMQVSDLGDGTSFFGRGWVTPTPVFWGWTLVQAVGSVLAVGMLTRAYQIGETSYIAVFEYAFLIFASFWGWVLWGDQLDLLGGVGMAMIILSGGVIALRTADA